MAAAAKASSLDEVFRMRLEAEPIPRSQTKFKHAVSFSLSLSEPREWVRSILSCFSKEARKTHPVVKSGLRQGTRRHPRSFSGATVTEHHTRQA